MEKFRTVQVPMGYQMVSFDVRPLFTNVPLEYTIDLVLKRIYENHEISTSITRNEMGEALPLCTKNVHFTFRDVIYLQTDRVAMGSPLGQVMAGILMVDLERSLLPLLTIELNFWKPYVDVTITLVKIGTVDHILSMLNNVNPNIQFTYGTEYNFKLAFLDIMLCRDGKNIVPTVYRKVTSADVYLNWNSFAPRSWKQGTLKTLTQRAYTICSTTELLNTEHKYLEKVFLEKNNYLKWVNRQLFTKIKFINGSNLSSPTIETKEVPANENETVTKKHMLLLPYQGDIVIGLTKSLKRNLNKHLPNNVKSQVTFNGRKLNTQFNVKDRTKFEHQHGVINFGKCPE